MNSIDVEIRKQETWGPQPAVTGGNSPSHPPTHPSLRGWHTERNLPALHQEPAGGSFWKLCHQQSRAWAWAGSSCHPLWLATAAKKKLNPAPRDGGSSDYTSRELHSFLFPNLSVSIMHKKGLRGRQGNGASAPETVTSCCQRQAS